MVSVMAGFSFENMLYPSCNKLDTGSIVRKLSLQYHPDKSKNKGALEKFAKINNEKRKNYDLYRDEKGNPGFDAGNAGDQGGYTYFTSGPGQNGFNFKPNEWQNMGGGHGSSKSFSFSFGGPGGHSSFGFGLEDIFSNFFGGGGAQSESFSGLTRSESKSRSASKSIRAVNVQTYKKEITDKGMTWLLLSCTSTLKGAQSYKSVGSINCEIESSFCKDLGVYPRRTPRVFVYSYRVSDSGSLVEYNGDLANISQGFQNVLDLNHFEFSSGTGETLPKVLLLSTKKDTPVIWRVLSGLYHKRFVFYDAEVRDVSDPAVRKLGVDALPAVVGWLSNGEKHTLKTRISVKDIKSAVEDLSALLDGFEKRNKKAASSQAKKPHCEAGDKHIPLLLPFNFDAACGDTTPVCIIGAFRSSKARGKLETILSSVSQKSLLRRRSLASSSGDAIGFALLDASKHQSFLNSLNKSGFKSLDKLVGKFAAFVGEISTEEVERFIDSVLNGDVKFSKTRQKPTLKMDGSAFYLQEKHFDEIFVTRGGGLKMLDPVGRAFCCSVLANIF
ncbi:hypothetical protein ACSBR2_021835 [Camellia fascicularis]